MEIIFEFYFTKDISVSFILDCLRFWTCEYMADGFHLTGEVSDISEIVNDPYLSDVKIYANYLCEISDKNKSQIIIITDILQYLQNSINRLSVHF